MRSPTMTMRTVQDVTVEGQNAIDAVALGSVKTAADGGTTLIG
jgi:hypothetical protein